MKKRLGRRFVFVYVLLALACAGVAYGGVTYTARKPHKVHKSHAQVDPLNALLGKPLGAFDTQLAGHPARCTAWRYGKDIVLRCEPRP